MTSFFVFRIFFAFASAVALASLSATVTSHYIHGNARYPATKSTTDPEVSHLEPNKPPVESFSHYSSRFPKHRSYVPDDPPPNLRKDNSAEQSFEYARQPVTKKTAVGEQKLQVVSCGDFPLSAACVWRAASDFDVTEIPSADKSISGLASVYDRATRCARRHEEKICNASDAVKQLEDFQMEVMNAENAAAAAIDYLSLPKATHTRDCKLSVRKFKNCYDRTYHRLLVSQKREACRRLEFHKYCMANSKILQGCPFQHFQSLVDTDETLRYVLEQVWCYRLSSVAEYIPVTRQENIALKSLLDLVTAQHSALQYAVKLLNCKLNTDNCSM